MLQRTTRRKFLATGLTTTVGLIGCSAVQQQQESTAKTTLAPTAIPQRQLGRTQVQLPILGLGGAGQTPLSKPNQKQAALAQIQRALELGIRYFDTAASYGPSEDYLGEVLPPYRQQLFLGSKTTVRDADGAWRELERSLTRLNTDYLDLWQMHSISSEAHLDEMFGPNGAIKALEKAKDQGLVRFGGITGHHEPALIAEGLRRYPFDHTLIPINAADPHHPRPFVTGALPVARSQNTGVTAMKVPAYGRLLKPGALDGIHQAMGYALSQPGVHCAIIAAQTLEQLEENVKAAIAFQTLDAEALAAIEQRTAKIWEENSFFRAWG